MASSDGRQLGGDAAISEMAIVDTFTGLIFATDNEHDMTECQVINALRSVDANVLSDSERDMGEYLRNLEVGEMIQLVARVHATLAGHCSITAVQTTRASRSLPDSPGRTPV